MAQLIMQILISYSCCRHLCLKTTGWLCTGHPRAGTHTCMGGAASLVPAWALQWSLPASTCQLWLTSRAAGNPGVTPTASLVCHIKAARGKPHGSLEASMVTLGSKSCCKPHKPYRQFSAETAETPSHKIKSKSKTWKPWSLVEPVSTTSKSVMTSLFNSFMTTIAKPQLFSTQYLKTVTSKADYLLSFQEM